MMFKSFMTLIEYQIAGFQMQPVQLRILNVLGQEIKILVDKKQSGGNYRVIWDGRNDQGQIVASGVYIYQLKTMDYSKVKKLVILR